MVFKKILLSFFIFSILVASGSVILWWNHPRFGDVRNSFKINGYLNRQIETVHLDLPEKIEEDEIGDIDEVAKLMAVTFDAIETASGKFDFAGYPYSNSMEIFNGRENKLLCGGISSFFGFLLKQRGYETRVLQLLGNKYVAGTDPYDSHVAVEFKTKSTGRWVLADVTFDTFWSCGEKNFIDYKGVRECLEGGQELKPLHLREQSPGVKKLSDYGKKRPPKQVFFSGKGIEREALFYNWEWLKDTLIRKDHVLKNETVYEYPREGIYSESVRQYRK